jgi:hypothetical protein
LLLLQSNLGYLQSLKLSTKLSTLSKFFLATPSSIIHILDIIKSFLFESNFVHNFFVKFSNFISYPTQSFDILLFITEYFIPIFATSSTLLFQSSTAVCLTASLDAYFVTAYFNAFFTTIHHVTTHTTVLHADTAHDKFIHHCSFSQ